MKIYYFVAILSFNIYLFFKYIIIFNKSSIMINDDISLVLPSTLSTYKKCKRNINKMINESYMKPFEVIIIVSENKNDVFINEIIFGVTYKLFFRKGKHNQADNRNYGIKIAKGKYISLFDSDDYMSKSRIEIIFNTFQKYNYIDFILHSYTYVRKDLFFDNISNYDLNKIAFKYTYNDIYQSYIRSNETSLNNMYCCRFLNNGIHIHNAWISGKSEIMKRNKYNESWMYYRIEDTELNYRLIMKKYKFLLIRFNLGYYLHNSQCDYY